jgi:Type ISP C-terminal specificity domain
LYYDRILIDRHRPDLAKQRGTIFLITRRNSRQLSPNWTFAFVTKNLPAYRHRGGVYAFPLQVNGEPNFSRQFLDIITKLFSHSIDPLDILGYIYAILYSNEYRKKYSDDLRLGFPRIPITTNQDMFIEVSAIGKTLMRVHLLEDQEIDNYTGFPESGTDIIKKIEYIASESRVYMNENQYFSKISLEIWNYQVGGYQICRRWLQERLGRRLRSSEQRTFIHIVGAIRKTIELQRQIDIIYPAVESRTFQISPPDHDNHKSTLIG